ncbi:Ubiquitin thioesterase otubain-like isoform 2, partial [Schistosoma japonicum]
MGIETLVGSVDENTDEATQAQQEAIENDMKSTCLISAILPLSTLDEDFNGHSVYLEKLKLMKQNYRGIRRLRRDGNCFYRAFGFAYIEYLLSGKLIKEAGRFKKKCDVCKDTLIANGYTQFTVEDFHEQFVGMVDRFTVDNGTLEELEEVFNDQAYSDYYVVFLRLLVSAYIQKNAGYFVNFIDEDKTVSQFCET